MSAAGGEPPQRARGLYSLLDEGGEGEARPPREEPVTSRHPRVEVPEPAAAPTADSARSLCARICRAALRDFAPVVLLLRPAERERLQALIAYAKTLLDFPRDQALEGEKLAQLNRWQFALEQSLDGTVVAQPVFMQLAAVDAHAPWPRDAFDRLHGIAARRIAGAKKERYESSELAVAFLTAMLGEPPAQSLVGTAAAVLRLATLLGWGDGLWQRRPDLRLGQDDDDEVVAAAVRAESRAIVDVLDSAAELGPLPARLRPAARFSLLLARRLAGDAARGRVETLQRGVGLWTRLSCLLRARLSG